MYELFRTLNCAPPNSRNMILTVIDGPDFGAKCFLSDGKILWEDERHFFSRQESLRGSDEIIPDGSFSLGGQEVLAELLGQEKKLVICGGGHVARALISLGIMTGFAITVLEDRPEFAEAAKLSGAQNVICAPFAEGLAGIPGDEDTYFVIVTRGHRSDKDCLSVICRKPHAYIGMIGSKKRGAALKEVLIAEGAPADVIGAVYTPIGLKIGAETPEEIAVSIMAELIAVRSQSGRASTYPKEILRAVIGHDGSRVCGTAALASIIRKSGSAPRGVGAKMLISADGSTVGTVGGGLLEAHVIRKTLDLLAKGPFPPVLLHEDMTAEDPTGEDMICGGTADVIIEWI
ncbi:MAG: XdhC family protein [Clostridia bacterium]|nr:XdhC family protein [Clostridia bacterium]